MVTCPSFGLQREEWEHVLQEKRKQHARSGVLALKVRTTHIHNAHLCNMVTGHWMQAFHSLQRASTDVRRCSVLPCQLQTRCRTKC